MALITYFKNYATHAPYHVPIEQVIARIRDGAIKQTVEQIRQADPETAKRLKRDQLPCILFAGKFSKRNDASLEQHSGLTILDFDHVDVDKTKAELAKFPWIFLAFRSPSGDGVKAVAKIPADSDKHRGYFKGIQKELSHLQGFDPTSINPSRICFESYDPDIYVNLNASDYTGYVSDEPKPEPKQPERKALVTDYVKLNQAVQLIIQAPNGQKHAALLKASRLCGGWVAGGQVDYQDALQALQKAIGSREVDDIQQAYKTIQDGLKHGMEAPLVNEEVNLIDDDFSFVSTEQDEASYLGMVRTQTLPQGLSTGYPDFDRHFRFKRGNLVIVNGHDNVGKSSFLWYMAVLANVLHGWRWILYCAENSEPQVRKQLIQFRAGKALHEMNPVEYDHHMRWAYENFTIIKSEKIVTAHELLIMATKVNARSFHDAFLIDPYNALDLDLENTKMNSHEYHYRVTSEFRAFSKRHQTAIYLNCHAVTEALRRTHKDGPYTNYPMAPNKADTEGGGKFANRADDFLTIHRYTQHPTDYNLTEVHVRKIKETETGGRPTLKDDPIKFKMEKGIHGFFNPIDGYNPLTNELQKQQRAEQTIRKLVWREEEEDEVQNFNLDPGDCPY